MAGRRPAYGSTVTLRTKSFDFTSAAVSGLPLTATLRNSTFSTRCVASKPCRSTRSGSAVAVMRLKVTVSICPRSWSRDQNALSIQSEINRGDSSIRRSENRTFEMRAESQW